MNNREKNKQIAQETLSILDKGNYLAPNGSVVSIKDAFDAAISGSILYTPKETNDFTKQISTAGSIIPSIEVTNETTLHAAKRLLDSGAEKVIALNFASARHAGGGFINGAMAQEESIAYSSGLYPAINQMKEMYDHNNNQRTGLYSDYMIYSPNIPVFRNDKYQLIDDPYCLSVITSPAVNAGIVRERESEPAINQIAFTMQRRIEKILSIAVLNSYDTIVLGAFGCGVFKNNPKDVAKWFKKAIEMNPKLKNQFKKIVFAVLDTTPGKQTYYSFLNTFK